MRIEVVTPSGSALTGTCTRAVVPTKMGEITVLPEHIPVISTLAHGRLSATVDGEEHIFAIAGGFIEVGKESINVVAETAIRPADIDIDAEQERKLEVESMLADVTSLSIDEIANLNRELVRTEKFLGIAAGK